MNSLSYELFHIFFHILRFKSITQDSRSINNLIDTIVIDEIKTK
jgi:hypothetical protein